MNRTRSVRRLARLAFGVSILILLQVACSVTAPAPTPTPAPTATQPPTLTATALPTSTRTPAPTATATATLTATPNRTATAEVKATGTAQARIAYVEPFLEKYGFKASEGEVGFFEPDANIIESNTYGTFVYNFINPYKYKDFVFQTEATWNSTGGLAGCGVIFRSDGDIDNGSYYDYAIIRLQNAPYYWFYHVQYNTIQTRLGRGTLSAINDTQGSTNVMTVVANKDHLVLYVNGTKIKDTNYSKVWDGQIALVTHQESGKTSCSFANTWVWEIK